MLLWLLFSIIWTSSLSCDKDSYYSGISALASDTEPSTRDEWLELINDLINLLKDTHERVTYTSSSSLDVWDCMKAVDRDHTKGDDSNVYVKTIYSNTSLTFESAEDGDWNREHVYVKSFGIGGSGVDYSDVHNLVPAIASVNSARNDKYYDNCNATEDATCKQPAHALAADDTGTNIDSNSYGRWMPPADVRGDLARMNFYTALRYNGSYTESYTEQLTLSACPCKRLYAHGNLTSLLSWAEEDPVSQREIDRNNAICSDWQMNRNPFVDFAWLKNMYKEDPAIPEIRVDCISDWDGSETGVCHPDYVYPSSAPTTTPSSAPTAEPTAPTSEPTSEPTSAPTASTTVRRCDEDDEHDDESAADATGIMVGGITGGFLGGVLFSYSVYRLYLPVKTEASATGGHPAISMTIVPDPA